jgi:hypothetical protein
VISPIQKTGIFLIDRFCLSGHIVWCYVGKRAIYERPEKCVIVVDVRHVRLAAGLLRTEFAAAAVSQPATVTVSHWSSSAVGRLSG